MPDLEASPQPYITLELLYYSHIVLGLVIYLKPNSPRVMNIERRFILPSWLYSYYNVRLFQNGPEHVEQQDSRIDI